MLKFIELYMKKSKHSTKILSLIVEKALLINGLN